jgi:glycine/D-amino acid oxidase-like deaminating enzyme
MQHFKHIVIGAGMMGAAAAKYLAGASQGVALIGPDEPVDKSSHEGVFASHYDEGRITRTIDPDPVWARLAHQSIARYRAIEQQSGVGFYHPVGCLLTGPKRGGADDYIANVLNAAATLDARVDVLDNKELADGFSYFAFPQGSEGVYEKHDAGHISPRKLVKAQCILAEKAGATCVRDVATKVADEGARVVVSTVQGQVYSADQVLVAAGGFSNGQALLPQRLALQVYARTIVFFEVSDEEAARLASMPSLITKAERAEDSIYMLPPIRYPDGKFYLKIGGDPVDIVLENDADMRAWFRSHGRANVRDHLVGRMRDLVPDLKIAAITSAACVTSYTPSSYPMIGFTASPRIAVMAGCAGTSAKSSDEIGRLGSELMLHGRIRDAAYATDFAPEFVGS